MTTQRCALLLAAGLVLGLAIPADAEASFRVRTEFRVGGFDFGFGFHSAPYRYAPDYYYRVPRPIAHRGYTCGSACFRSAGAFFHHPTCPVVLHHFRVHRFDPGHHWGRYDRHLQHRYDVWSYRGHPGHHGYRGRGGYYERDRRHYERDRRHYERDRRRDGRGYGVYRYWEDPRWRDPYERDHRRHRDDDSDSDRRHRRRPY